MQTKKQSGFTLIELMIVVAIVAILAAVAIPAYQDYIKRAKMSEVAAAAGACKTSVSEYYASNSVLPTTMASAGCSPATSQYVSGMAVGASGVITATADATEIGITSGSIILTPIIVSNSIDEWRCSGGGDAQYRPASCR